MATSIYQNLLKNRQYKASTGLSMTEFDALYHVFAPFYEPKKPSPSAGTRAPILSDKREALFFILHYYKAYPTLENFALYFGISDASASHYLEWIKPALKAALQQLGSTVNQLFHGQAGFAKAFEGVQDLVIDVTEVPIERAKDQEVQQEHYSGKKISYAKMVNYL